MSLDRMILSMIDELKSRPKKTHQQLLTSYIQLRMDKSLQTYYNELLKDCERLRRYNELKVLRGLLKDGK